jgi:hypothetical protein
VSALQLATWRADQLSLQEEEAAVAASPTVEVVGGWRFSWRQPEPFKTFVKNTEKRADIVVMTRERCEMPRYDPDHPRISNRERSAVEMARGGMTLNEQARRAALRERRAKLLGVTEAPQIRTTETLRIVRDDAGHDHWIGTTRTTDLKVEAERSATYRGTCSDPRCVRPDHQRT